MVIGAPLSSRISAQGDVIPSITELIEYVKADPITNNCSIDLLNRHVLIGALEIRKLLLVHGLEEGWRKAKILFGGQRQCMTMLNRELNAEEKEFLSGELGYEEKDRDKRKGLSVRPGEK